MAESDRNYSPDSNYNNNNNIVDTVKTNADDQQNMSLKIVNNNCNKEISTFYKARLIPNNFCSVVAMKNYVAKLFKGHNNTQICLRMLTATLGMYRDYFVAKKGKGGVIVAPQI